MDSKYKMFRNFMYNDLGITKEDIQNWTKEAVKEVATDFVKHHFNSYDINKMVKDYLDGSFVIKGENIRRYVADEISKRIELKIKPF